MGSYNPFGYNRKTMGDGVSKQRAYGLRFHGCTAKKPKEKSAYNFRGRKMNNQLYHLRILPIRDTFSIVNLQKWWQRNSSLLLKSRLANDL